MLLPERARRVLAQGANRDLVAGLLRDKINQLKWSVKHAIAKKSSTEIATLLNLSAKTVSNYISNVLLKMHATDRAKLMLMALDAGMGQKDKQSLIASSE